MDGCGGREEAAKMPHPSSASCSLASPGRRDAVPRMRDLLPLASDLRVTLQNSLARFTCRRSLPTLSTRAADVQRRWLPPPGARLHFARSPCAQTAYRHRRAAANSEVADDPSSLPQARCPMPAIPVLDRLCSPCRSPFVVADPSAGLRCSQCWQRPCCLPSRMRSSRRPAAMGRGSRSALSRACSASPYRRTERPPLARRRRSALNSITARSAYKAGHSTC